MSRRNDIQVIQFPRLLGKKELAEYTSLGTESAEELGTVARARRKVGKRILYDRLLVDKYIDKMEESL